MDSEEAAISQVERELKDRGFSVIHMSRNSHEGDIHAKKNNKRIRFEVKGLDKRNGVWLKKYQIDAVDIIVVYIVEEDNVWVLSPDEAHTLVNHYESDFIKRNGRSPKALGWNASQFPKPTGWKPLDRLLS